MLAERRRRRDLEREITGLHTAQLELGRLEKNAADLEAEAAIFERYDEPQMAALLRATAAELEG